jgi:hypothetical protein
VGTNYHVAKVMGKYVRIKGVFSAHRYLDSDPDDAGAEDVEPCRGRLAEVHPGSRPCHLRDAASRQELPWHRLRRQRFGEQPEVDIYAYPFNWNPKRGLVRWHGRFIGKTQQGLLAFSYEEGRVRGGASGGIVVDSNTKKIVGILNGIGEGKDRIALAVPVKELSDFVTTGAALPASDPFSEDCFRLSGRRRPVSALRLAPRRRSFAAPRGAARGSQAAAHGAASRRLDA